MQPPSPNLPLSNSQRRNLISQLYTCSSPSLSETLFLVTVIVALLLVLSLFRYSQSSSPSDPLITTYHDTPVLKFSEILPSCSCKSQSPWFSQQDLCILASLNLPDLIFYCVSFQPLHSCPGFPGLVKCISPIYPHGSVCQFLWLPYLKLCPSTHTSYPPLLLYLFIFPNIYHYQI